MARNFDGSSGVITTPIASVLRPSLPISIAAWINPDTINGMGIFTNNKTTATHRGVWFVLNGTGGNLEVSYGDSGGGTSSDRRSKVAVAGVTTGVWQHVSCSVRGATDSSIYRNGADVGGTYSGTGGAMSSVSTAGGRIGSFQGGFFFDGRIAEVGFWNVSLTAAEHLALAKGVAPLRIRPQNLLGYWPIYGVASPEADLSGSQNNGTVVGTAPGADHAPVGQPFSLAA